MVYQLDIINRKILYELDKNCRISDNQLAKKVNLSRESVRNRIKKLKEEEIIQGFITSINPSKFGYMFFKLYFQLANNSKERDRFYEYLKRLPGLYWFGGNDGVWDFHATIYAKNVKEFNQLKNKLYTQFRNLIIKRDLGMLVNVRQYSKRYILLNHKERTEPVLFADDIVENELQDIDKKILNNLAQNAKIGLIELAHRNNSTIDIVRNRIKKLEERKIIMQYRVAINHTKLGYNLFKAFMYFNNLSEQDENKLFEYAKTEKRIVYLIRQLSAWDIELEIMAQSYEEFTKIMDDLRLTFSDSLRNYEFVLMREDIWVFGEKDIF